MRKLLKVLAYLVAGLVALIAIAAVAVYFGSNAKLKKTYAVNVKPVTVPAATDAVALARGPHIGHYRKNRLCIFLEHS